VFGWQAVDRDYGALPHTEFEVGDDSVAGIVVMDECWAAAQAWRWMPHVEVADSDAAARATGLGAEIRVGPTTVEPGRYAILTDPTGARLGIITFDPMGRGSFRTVTITVVGRP
jgi:predicted enzyme related to lactoylglutathione lyase